MTGESSLEELPSGWSIRRLGEIAERVRRPLSGEPEHILMISSTVGFMPQGERYSRFMAGKSLEKYVELHGGEFSYNRGNSKTYPQGCAYRLNQWARAAVPNVYISFMVSPNQADARFLEFYFRAGSLNTQLARVITSGARGNGLLNISAEDFFGVHLLLPSPEEQCRIAAILQVADDAVNAAQRVIEQTEKLKRGVVAQLNASGMPGWNNSFKALEEGEIPESWTVQTLGEIGNWLSGGTPSMSNPAFWEGDLPWVSPKDMKIARLSDAQDHVSELAVGNGTRLVPSGAILVVVRGMILAHSVPVAQALRPLAFNQDIKALLCNSNVDSDFVLYWFQMNANRVLGIVSESTHGTKRIPTEALFQLPIALPPVHEQQAIVSKLKIIDDLQEANKAALKSLTTARAGLTRDLLQGILRVPK